MEKVHDSNLLYTKHRASFLDLSDSSSGIKNNELRGFYVLFILVTSFYILTASINKFFNEGYFIEDSFFWAMVEDGKFVALMWPSAFLYTWLAYILQLLILKGLPPYLATIFQHLTQSIMFIVTTYVVLERNWGFTQTLFSVSLTFSHFMMMHSYTMVNRDYRRDYLRGVKDCPYPQNINMKNYFIFLLTPALVYQVEYPKRPNFRIGYFLLKLILFFVEVFVTYTIITENMILTLNNAKNMPFIEVCSKLTLPLIVFYNLMFLLIFEQLLNLFAELSYFADREFYQDWWNSNGFEEFSRKWNRPVHLFLHKHVYLECINEFKLTKERARLVTFIFSSCCHEFLVAMLVRRITPYLFGMMMFQFPLMILVKIVNNKEFGMYLFWTGIITGPPLLFTLYAKY